MCCSNFLYWWKFHQYSILKTPAYCCRIKRRTFWGDLAPQELKNGSCVGSNFRTGRKWTPLELKIFNLVGSNFRPGRKWTPREFKIFNLVGSNFRPGRKWTPRELRIFNLVGPNFRPGRKWTPRELRIFNLVGSNFQTGRKWAPREFKRFNLVGQSFWIDLFLKVSGDSHIGVKWNWPYALTPCPLAQWIFGFKMLCEAYVNFKTRKTGGIDSGKHLLESQHQEVSGQTC